MQRDTSTQSHDAPPGSKIARRVRARSLVLLAALATALVRPAGAMTAPLEIEGVRFDAEAEAFGTTLGLQGVGLLRYRWVIKAYVGALYLAPGTAPTRVLDDVPKRLELEYFYGIEGEKFGRAAEQLLRENLDRATFDSLRERLDTLHALYEDVEPGERYAISYQPGRGLALSKNGVVKGTIAGADFAEAYFSIWLGANPVSESFKSQLLDPSQRR